MLSTGTRNTAAPFVAKSLTFCVAIKRRQSSTIAKRMATPTSMRATILDHITTKAPYAEISAEHFTLAYNFIVFLFFYRDPSNQLGRCKL